MNVASSIRDAWRPRPAAALPFEAYRRLCRAGDDAGGSHLALFGDAARATLARSLLHKLSSVSALPLLDAFDRRRPPGRQLLARLLAGEARAAAPAAEFQAATATTGSSPRWSRAASSAWSVSHRVCRPDRAEAWRFHAPGAENGRAPEHRLAGDRPAVRVARRSRPGGGRADCVVRSPPGRPVGGDPRIRIRGGDRLQAARPWRRRRLPPLPATLRSCRPRPALPASRRLWLGWSRSSRLSRPICRAIGHFAPPSAGSWRSSICSVRPIATRRM